jgi:flagellar hook-length control protein FliK
MCQFLLIISIEIIMPQVNVLPVNISKNIELKDESVSFDSTESKEDFSQYINLHLNKNKGSDKNSKVDDIKSEASVAKYESTAKESKPDTIKSGELDKNSEESDESGSDDLVQKVAASGNEGQSKSDATDQKALLESEQLMTFLTKADNTLINQQTNNQQTKSSSTPASEQLSVEQKAHNEAQLLLNASKLVADLSPVAKALGDEQVDETLATTSTNKGLTAEEKLLIDAAKVSSNKVTSANASDELVIEGKNKANVQTEAPISVVKSTENKAITPDLKVEAKTDTATQVITDVKVTNTSGDKANTTQQAPSYTEGEAGVKNNDNIAVSAEQKTAKQLKIDSAQMNTENALKKEVIQNAEQEEAAQSQLSDKDKINLSVTTQSTTKSQAESDTARILGNKVDEKAEPVDLTKQNRAEKNSNLSDAQLTKSELTQSSQTSTANDKINQTAVSLKDVILPKNQGTSNDINHDEVNKIQAKQDEKAQLSAAITEQGQQKLAAKNEGELVVEAKPIANANRESSANGHFIDVSGRATQTPQQIIEQQSAEMLNPSVATEVTQSQKTNGQLHQETISMFRKDFTDAVKDKVMLMISQKLQRFDITLDPPELGNMQVRVNLQGEQAAVSFIVQSQQTKDALEQNMHKLRELLAEQGVDVGDANVEQQSQQSANEEGSPTQQNNHMEGDIDNMADANDVVAHTLSAQMIDSSTTSVDYYA